MLGFEHPSHMVTHPSTDEAQCCLSLEIFVNSAKKKKKKKKKEDENRIKSPLRIEGTKKSQSRLFMILFHQKYII